MPSFRNTIEAVWAAFFTHMQQLASGGSPPVKSVVEGETSPHQYEHPYVAIQVLSAEPTDRADYDKKWTVKCRARITTTSPGPGLATQDMLDKIATVNDKIELFPKPLGVSGFEDMDWSITDTIGIEQGKVLIADSTFTFAVMVSRGAN